MDVALHFLQELAWEKNRILKNQDGGEWMSMNCGHIQKEKLQPPMSKFCHYDRGLLYSRRTGTIFDA